ncbi:MAG: oligosaccharide flippase family protein, partial [Erysipelotrichaceae bacterium]
MKNKKQSLILGGLLGSAGIFISKLIGIIYVIPFTALIGEGNLVYYSSAYRIYEYLINISLAGFPFAIATLVAKYSSYGDYKTSLLVRKLSIGIMSVLGFLSMALLILFATPCASALMPAEATPEALAITRNVLIIIALALFFVPVLSAIRGFYQGLKNMEIYALSQVLEQLSRVIFLLGAGALCVYVFNMDQIWAVYFAVLSTSISAILAIIHIKFYDKQRMPEILKLANQQEAIPNTNHKALLSEILRISMPYLIMAILGYSYSLLDTAFYSHALETYYTNSETFATITQQISLNFNNMVQATSSFIQPVGETINYTIATAAAEYSSTIFGISFLKVAKLIAIPMILSPGFSLAIIPYITTNLIKKDYKELRRNILDCVDSVLYLGTPICFCLFALAKPIYYFMYGGANLTLGTDILQWYTVDAFFGTITPIFSSLMMVLELRKENIINLVVSVILKLILVVPMLTWWSYSGAVISGIIAYVILIILDVIILKKKYQVSF